MKSKRQLAILDIIAQQDIETQEELAEALRARAISVTQATISRDIKELRLVKVASAGNVYKYAPPDRTDPDLKERFYRMLGDSVLTVAVSGTMLVIHTLSGSAGVACEALDSMEWPETLGTIAGDNTIFMVVRSEKDAPVVAERIKSLIG